MHRRLVSQVRFFGVIAFIILSLVLTSHSDAEPLSDKQSGSGTVEQYEFKPLVDRTHEVPQLDDAVMRDIYGEPAGTTPFVLTGRVENLENAIRIERDQVDWYGWYLGARSYLSKWGGLDCPPGTPLKFYRNGVIEVDSTDMACQASVVGKIFPLPEETRLDAVILPVRLGKLPPASQGELYSHIKASEAKN